MYNDVLDYHKGTISKCIFAFWVDLEKQKFETASHDLSHATYICHIRYNDTIHHT